MFKQADYNLLHQIVFKEDYPGYRPNVEESPNGDGKWDSQKRYAHVAQKYFENYPDGSNKRTLIDYLNTCHELAITVAKEVGVPKLYFPVKEYSALRVLEYPPGAYANEHYDFDLFTLMMYRDQSDKFEYVESEPPKRIQTLNQHIHYGELMEEIGISYPTKHKVLPSDTTQHSIVYFAIPDWDAPLDGSLSVGEWLEERLKRSRQYK